MARRIAKGFVLFLLTLLLWALALILWPAAQAPLPDLAQSRIIDNVRIIDVETGEVSAPSSVLIRDGRIAAIGGPDLATGLPRMDGGGGYLVPSFWDMHVHSFQASPQFHLPLFIANGVTHVRDMMDCPEASDSLLACAADKKAWNAKVAAGEMVAPRFVETASYYLEGADITPDEARARVRQARARGIDAVKVYNRLSGESFAAAADEARAQGLRLVGHLPKAVSLEDALAAGQASFEHAHLLPRHCFDGAAEWRAGALDGEDPVALIDSMVERHDPAACAQAFAEVKSAGAWLVPTHVTREEDARASDPAFTDDPRLDYLDPLSRWAWQDDLSSTATYYAGAPGRRALARYFDHGLALTGRAHAAGVGILVGTDTVIGGFRYHDELRHLGAAGLSPLATLRAATIEAARYAGMEKESGSIAIGKRADLVLLSANPLDDIGNAARIVAVVQQGRLYDRPRLDALLAFAKDEAAAWRNSAKLLWAFARSSVMSEL